MREVAKLPPPRAGDYFEQACQQCSGQQRGQPAHPIPGMGFNTPKTTRAMVWGVHKEVTVRLADYHAHNYFAWVAQYEARKHCGVKILDLTPFYVGTASATAF